MGLTFVVLNESIYLDDFDCAEEQLNAFLTKSALLYQRRHFGVTIVCKEKKDLIGYYTLCPACIEKEQLEKKTFTGPRPNPIPAFRICRLAIDKRYQGKGYGKRLFVHALKKCVDQAKEIGGSIVIIDAKNEKAKHFYMYFGFKPLPDNGMVLIQTIKYLEHHFAIA